jgi:hypothetical protein
MMSVSTVLLHVYAAACVSIKAGYTINKIAPASSELVASVEGFFVISLLHMVVPTMGVAGPIDW